MNDRYKIAVRMPLTLFKKLKERARKQKKSISDVAADAIACGLFDLEESEAMDPMEKETDNGITS